MKARVQDKLEKDYNKKIIAEYKIDKSIIGGIIIRTENSQTDASVKSRLGKMRAVLSENSLKD